MKTNLEPSQLTRSCTGWFWVVQVITGDSQEEVMIFCYKHTDKQTLHHYIYIIITTAIIIFNNNSNNTLPPRIKVRFI